MREGLYLPPNIHPPGIPTSVVYSQYTPWKGPGIRHTHKVIWNQTYPRMGPGTRGPADPRETVTVGIEKKKNKY